MAQLLVLTFDDEREAVAALTSVRRIEREGRLHLQDTALVSKNADGKAQSRTRSAALPRSPPSAARSLARC